MTQDVDPKKVIHGLGHQLFRWGDGDKATVEQVGREWMVRLGKRKGRREVSGWTGMDRGESEREGRF